MSKNNEVRMLVNNTGADTRPYDAEIWKAIRNGGKLPEVLVDLFSLEIREVVSSKTGKPELRAFLSFA